MEVDTTVNVSAGGDGGGSPAGGCASFYQDGVYIGNLCGGPTASGGSGSKLLNKVKNVARAIGNYIPTVCGSGSFSYAGARGSIGLVSGGYYSIASNDTRSGKASGRFGDVTAGEVIQVGAGRAAYSDGSKENFLFAGAGFDGIFGSGSATQYASHVSGDSVLRNQFGLNFDATGFLSGGGLGFGFNTDSITSCIDNGFH
jgi:hypothetical protein